MEWWVVFIVVFVILVGLMCLGLPVAFCFIPISMVGAFLLLKGELGLVHFISSIFESLASFTLVPLALFVLMGEVMFLSGVATRMIDTVDMWLGRLPGRLSLLAVASGTLFATLSGSSIAGVALLGSMLVPEMEKRGYKKSMSLGPILGAGGLAFMIPPSNLAVLLAAIAELSVGKILIAIIVPGLLLAVLYAIYVIGRCWLQPSIAPVYEVPPISLSKKLTATARYILPLGFIVFLVIGLILVGGATPTEAAAAGTIGSFVLALAHRGLNWEIVKKTLVRSLEIIVMTLMIVSASSSFSEILVFTGATKGMVQWIIGLPIAPILVMVVIQVILLALGMFMGAIAIMMITLPIFMPVVYALGFDPVWFGVLFLVNMEVGQLTPPYGISLFVMKGVAPPGTTMGDIIQAAMPFILCDIVAIALIMAFPTIALCLL